MTVRQSCIAARPRKGYSRGVMRDCTVTKGQTLRDQAEAFVPGTIAYRLGLVWPLTREACSFSPRHNAERRLQRHVECFKRRAG
jgi:hypothetical protein